MVRDVSRASDGTARARLQAMGLFVKINIVWQIAASIFFITQVLVVALVLLMLMLLALVLVVLQLVVLALMLLVLTLLVLMLIWFITQALEMIDLDDAYKAAVTKASPGFGPTCGAPAGGKGPATIAGVNGTLADADAACADVKKLDCAAPSIAKKCPILCSDEPCGGKFAKTDCAAPTIKAKCPLLCSGSGAGATCGGHTTSATEGKDPPNADSCDDGGCKCYVLTPVANKMSTTAWCLIVCALSLAVAAVSGCFTMVHMVTLQEGEKPSPLAALCGCLAMCGICGKAVSTCWMLVAVIQLFARLAWDAKNACEAKLLDDCATTSTGLGAERVWECPQAQAKDTYDFAARFSNYIVIIWILSALFQAWAKKEQETEGGGGGPVLGSAPITRLKTTAEVEAAVDAELRNINLPTMAP